MAIIDMTGQRYGRLVAIKQAPKPDHIKSRVAFWLFKCDCGNEVVLNGSNVRSGNTTSCGCLHSEITAQLHEQDLTGERFGQLTVIERIPRKGQKTLYKCLCDCGNESLVDGVNLKRGLTKSCGCNKFASYAVQRIEQLLKENNIKYRREVSLNLDGTVYFADFEIQYQDKCYYLEYDGKQHFQSGSESGWNTKEHLKKTHTRDLIKNKYCYTNNIPLIRIPYDHIQITLEDLLLGISKWELTPATEEYYYQTRMKKLIDRKDMEEC